MKKTYLNRLICLVFSLVLIVFLIGCQGAPLGAKSAEFFALDTVINLTAYADNPEACIEAGKAEIKRLESLLSVTKKDSDIFEINNSEGEEIEVSAETYKLLEKASEISSITSGKFDPTLRNLSSLWGFGTENAHVPTQSEIDSSLKTVGIENLVLSKNKVKLLNNTKVDLGGIAKGYIADKAAEAMINAGMSYGIINLGGNVRAVGAKQDKAPWKIGVKYPDTNAHFLIVECEDISIVTSGGYQRKFTENSKTYHHILNPETGYPADSDIKSVTVIGKDGTLCDGLSTALFVGGSEFSKELCQDNKNFDIIILTENDEILASGNLRGRLTLESPYQNMKITYIDSAE